MKTIDNNVRKTKKKFIMKLQEQFGSTRKKLKKLKALVKKT